MKLKQYQACRESRCGTQIAECLEIGSLAICRETTDNRLYLLYRQDVSSLLQEAGYDVQAEELEVPISEEDFSELQYTMYYGLGCEVYLFNGLAVKATLDSIGYYAQDGLRAEDLEQIWSDLGIDWKIPDSKMQIPLDQAGRMAVQIEQLQYDVWDTLYRAPGESMETEERLEGIHWLCDTLKDPKSGYQLLDDLRQTLTDELGELSDDQEIMGPERQNYTSGRIEDVNSLLEKVEIFRQEYSGFAEADAALEPQPVPGTELTM